MKTKLPIIAIASILVLSIVAVIVLVPTAPGEDTPGRLPWVSEDGIGDPALYPEFIEVLDSSGNVVGTLEPRLLDESDVAPVKDSDGEVVGHFGPNGFWALGDPEPASRGTTTVEEYGDPDSDRPTRIRVLNN